MTTKTFTPAFNIMNEFLKGAGKNKALRQFFSNAHHLSQDEISKGLQSIFEDVKDRVSLKTIEDFLSKAFKLKQDIHLTEKLEEIKRVGDQAEKAERLGKLLLNENLMTFFAHCLKEDRGFNQEEQFDRVNEANLKQTRTEAEARASQANVSSLEAALIRQALRLLFQFCDWMCVNIGKEPIFMPKEEPSDGKPKIKYLPMKM